MHILINVHVYTHTHTHTLKIAYRTRPHHPILHKRYAKYLIEMPYEVDTLFSCTLLKKKEDVRDTYLRGNGG